MPFREIMEIKLKFSQSFRSEGRYSLTNLLMLFPKLCHNSIFDHLHDPISFLLLTVSHKTVLFLPGWKASETFRSSWGSIFLSEWLAAVLSGSMNKVSLWSGVKSSYSVVVDPLDTPSYLNVRKG